MTKELQNVLSNDGSLELHEAKLRVSQDLQTRIQNSTVPSLSALSFFARRGADSGGLSVSNTDAHQTILGHGKEFTLAMFGWAGGAANIHDAFQAAISAAHAAGGGTVQLPAGALNCSAGVIVPNCWATNSGILIRGKGEFVTSIQFTTDVAIGIHFDGAGADPNYVIGSGCEGFTLQGYLGFDGHATGTGIKYSAAIICTTRDITVAGFRGAGGIGIQWVNVGAQNCQIQSILNVGVYWCSEGMRMDSIAQFTASHCKWNGCEVGCHILSATGAFIGGLIQAGGVGAPVTAGILIDTGVSSISFHGAIYVEGAWSQAIIKADGTATNIALDLHANFDCATDVGTLLYVESCSLACSGVWRTSNLTTFIKARTMITCLIGGQSGGPSAYDFDAASARVTTWVGYTGIAAGTPAPNIESAPRLTVRAAAYDGSYWPTAFPVSNFVALTAAIFGDLLREVFHAGMGVNLNSATATSQIDSWEGQFRGLVLPFKSGRPLWVHDGTNFRGRPVVATVAASAQSFQLAGISPAIFAAGEAPCIVGCARFAINASGTYLVGTGVSGVSDGIYIGDDASHHTALIDGTAITGPAFGTGQHQWVLDTDGSATSSLVIDGSASTTAAGAVLAADQTALAIGCSGSGFNPSTAYHGCWVFLRAKPSAAQLAAFSVLMTREFG